MTVAHHHTLLDQGLCNHHYRANPLMIVSDQERRKRELTPLQEIKDNYPKMILSMDAETPNTMNGIHQRNLIQWLLE